MTVLIHGPHGTPRLGDLLVSNLDSGQWRQFTAAVAFAKASGAQYLAAALTRFGEREGITRLAVGVDTQGTTYDGLDLLMRSVRGDARIVVVHNENGSTFHPKVHLFESPEGAELIVGSGNLTAGGLYTNYEAGLHVRLNASVPADAQILSHVRERLDEWTTVDGGVVQVLTPDLLDRLLHAGYVIREAEARQRRERERDTGRSSGSTPERLFISAPVPHAPRVVREPTPARGDHPVTEPPISAAATRPAGARRGFVMTLQRTDVGTGQLTPGASRRSPEVFIPLAARDYEPEFWGWPDLFREDASRPGKFDRPGVHMRLGAEVIAVNMMTWPVKHDFRLRSESLRSSGAEGDILRIERTEGSGAFEYYVEVIPQGTTLYDSFWRLCTHAVRNSQRRWGYYD